ncbi:polysaccharide biosynthesis tyrosine autokinase [Quadrisphaera sp. DSM 44207]|uniref:polysaccharide biosynthesis tyrosine autokinase n=1 Tax=Quadrisphaera sp. DSM 44207 TaxID=1881057 RepID=UPI00088E477A|nr:polysaccharide biosynthesis tyrosine autokinase [Quadrisphaera sp. DSM 44207]SDQ68480.1 capsular exopolysaccharide family [Quadrisphaera sp. DSM 44207]
MELGDYMRILRKRWLSVLVITVLGVAAAAAATLLATPQYRATTQLFVSAQTGDSGSDLLQGGNFAEARVQSYADIATSQSVLGPVIADLGLETTPAALAQRVEAVAPAGTVLIDITATDPSPEQAATIAEAVTASLIEVVRTLEQPSDAATAAPVRITSTQGAVVPSSPAWPREELNLALGLVLGLGAAVAVVLLREVLDTRVRGEEDVSALSVPLLAAVPQDASARRHPLVVVDDPQGPLAESFRRLRTNLQFATATNGAKSVVVTSSLEGEGKSTTAVNLALSLADAGARVVLVDGDLRRPSVARYLGLEGGVGLTTVLVGRAQLDDVLQPWGDRTRLSVLPAGQVPPNPSELLASEQMAKLVRELEGRFDVVLVDGAPLVPVTDSAVLAEVVGGVLVAVRSGSTRRPLLERALAALAAVDATVLGVVLTMLPTRGADGYRTYSYTSQPQPGGRDLPQEGSAW